MTDNAVNHPAHYTSHASGVECITITEHMGFNLGNAVKYIWRADLKSDDPITDLQKAAWYISREIKRRQKAVYDVAFAARAEAMRELARGETTGDDPRLANLPVPDAETA